MEHLCIRTCLPRCDIGALESFTTAVIAAEIDRRNHSDPTDGYSWLDRPHIMTPEYFHMQMEEMVNSSTIAFLTTVSQYREPEDNDPVNDEINKILSDACLEYRNIMNIILTNSLPQYTVLGHPLAINGFLRLQEREMVSLERYHEMITLNAVNAVFARINTSAPDEEAPREC